MNRLIASLRPRLSSLPRPRARFSLPGLLVGVALAAVAFAPSGADGQAAATVTVKIAGFHGTEGQALVGLYDSADNWLKVPKAVQVARAKITAGELTVELTGVKPGTYAINVIHDENKNNQLDMRWLPYPKPKEGTGNSNDADVKAGPPKWEAAKFEVAGGGASLSVTMKYP